MGFWLLVAVEIGLTILTPLLSRLPKGAEAEKPDVPDLTPGDPIPLFWGTVKVPLLVVDYFGWRAEAIKGPTRPYLFGLIGPKPTIGWRYYVKMVTLLGMGPIDEWVDLLVNNKSMQANGLTPVLDAINLLTGATYTLTPHYDFPLEGTITLDSPTLLGGEDQASFGNGGVKGPVRMRRGDGLAFQSPELLAWRPEKAVVPDWRRYTHIIWDDVWIGNSPSLPPLHAVVRRKPQARWGGELTGVWGAFGESDAEGDANPAGVVLELLTDPDTGLGLPYDLIDFTAFEYFAAAFSSPSDKSVAQGVSFMVSSKRPTSDIIRDVLRTVDGVLSTDPMTGKLKPWLIRSGDDSSFGKASVLLPAGVPTLDPLTALSFEYTPPAPALRMNTVQVKFTDRNRNYEESTVTVDNPALVALHGEALIHEVEFLGCSTEAMAKRLAMRELNAITIPLGRGTLKCTRAPVGVMPGQWVHVTWPEYGVDADMRVVDIDWGTLAEPTVTIQVVDDVYAAPGYLLDRPVSVPWTDPTPQGMQLPYFDYTQSQTSTLGTAVLIPVDPNALLTALDVQTVVGQGTPSGWVSLGSPPYTGTYTVTVALDGRWQSAIWYKGTYVLNGATDTVEGIIVFNSSAPVPVPSLSYRWPDADTIVVTAEPGMAVDGVRFAYSTTSPPTAADVAGSVRDTAAPYEKTITGADAHKTLYIAAASEVDEFGGATKSALARLTINQAATGTPGAIVAAFQNPTTDLPVATKFRLALPYACTITSYTLVADAAGSLVVDIWSDVYGSYPPTVADSITASAKPTLSSANKATDATLTGWTKSLPAGTVLIFNIDSCTGIKEATLTLNVTRAS